MNVIFYIALTMAWTNLGATADHGTPRPTSHQVQPGRTAMTSRLVLSAAPDFTLNDTKGKPRRLSDYLGRPVALYFFCGCEWCHRCAQVWGEMQRSGALVPEPALSSSPRPITVIVFSGDADSAASFVTSTQIDLTQTVVLADSSMQVTINLYKAEPCPRVFVINTKGQVTYSNIHKDDQPRSAPATFIDKRVLNEIRKAQSSG